MLSALVAGAIVVPAAARAEVNLTIVDGYVTIDAKDATVRQILAEWARVGQTRIVNAERVGGPAVTMQLTHVPEAEALDILLRSVSGYLAAPRSTAIANASRFDRILVMPTSAAPRVVAAAPQPQPQFPAPPLPEDLEIDEPASQPQPVAPPIPRGPIFTQFPNTAGQPGVNFPQRGPAMPQPAVANPQGQAFPPGGAVPSPDEPPPIVMPGAMPVGVSTPGMMVVPPTQPGTAPERRP